MYSTDWEGHYPATLDTLTPNYLKTLPLCPSAGSMTYIAQFGPAAPMNNEHFEDYYLVECAGEHHMEIIRLPDYPKYNSIEGLIER